MWGAGTSRPPGCASAACCTGLSGIGEPPDAAGLCPLVFTVSGAGVGLGAAIVEAITSLVTAGGIDVAAEIADDPVDAVDAVAAFIERVEADPAAAAPCSAGLSATDPDGDGVAEGFDDVDPGSTVCYDVVARPNTTVPAADAPQMFRATITIRGDGVTELDRRGVYFLVPPVIPPPPVE
jgi:hypothetical protein